MDYIDVEYANPFTHKRKKIQRACDECKRRKRRCEGPVAPSNKCSNCIIQDLKCTYETEQKKRGRPKGYAEKLEKRIRMLEEVLKKLCPNPPVLRNLISPFDPEYAEHLTNTTTWTSVSSSSHFNNTALKTSTSETAPNNAVSDMIHKVVSVSLGTQDLVARDEDDLEDDSSNLLSEQMKSLSIRPEDNRFWGESSGMTFVQAAISMKERHAPGAPAKQRTSLNKQPLSYKILPWDEYNDIRPAVTYTFPSPALIRKLIDAYFEHMNFFYPLLHRPTFERAVANNLHLHDDGFGSVLLLVCAVGSRYTENIDEPTLVNQVDPSLSTGWKWYKQVQVMRSCLVNPATLYDLQICCLAAEFISACCAPQKVWLLTGFGIRLAQDVGIHRRRIPREKLTVEDELWKRAFWVLAAMDRLASIALGRPCTVFDDHFDLDMPVECDDEYWEHPDPGLRFKQPEGVPSSVTTFNQIWGLTKIMAFAMGTIYSAKSKSWVWILQEWPQYIVTELDSALNNWISSLPEHLRWDPNRIDDRSFKMSGILINFYYYAQILIHRPYIRANTHPSPLSFSSLAICTSAARSCSLVLQQQMKHFTIVYPYMQMSCVSSMTVLLLNIGSSKLAGVTVDPKELKHVEMCVDILKRSDGRSYCAGPVLDIFSELLSTAESMLRDENYRKSDEMSKRCSSGSGCNLPSSSIPQVMHEMPRLQAIEHENQQSVKEHAFTSSYRSSSNISNTYGGSFDDLPITYDNNCDMSLNQSIQVQQVLGEPSLRSSRDDPSHETSFSPPFSNGHHFDTAASEHHVDSNTMAMWLNMPTGFEINEWNSFFVNFAEYTN
ncbi:fungal-specific transcription factor domain-containing protein [Cyathus striatus]|nr:fungal-specific transcription factor domain-containing protein [Cyathus striatus]